MARLKICHNLTLISKDKLVRKVFTESNNIFNPISATSKAFIPIFASIFALSFSGIYTNIDLQKTTRLTLKLFV